MERFVRIDGLMNIAAPTDTPMLTQVLIRRSPNSGPGV
jgi:hypothetical protein